MGQPGVRRLALPMERKTSKAEGAAAALLCVKQPGLRPLRTLVTFDEGAPSLRACGFEVFVELAFD